MEKLKVGDIVVYDPPDRSAGDYARHYIDSVGIVTEAPLPKRNSAPKRADETHVDWISTPPDAHGSRGPNPHRHYTKNLRKIGHITGEVPDGV